MREFVTTQGESFVFKENTKGIVLKPGLYVMYGLNFFSKDNVPGFWSETRITWQTLWLLCMKASSINSCTLLSDSKCLNYSESVFLLLFCLTMSGFYREKLEIDDSGIRNLSDRKSPMWPVAPLLILINKQYQIIETGILWQFKRLAGFSKILSFSVTINWIGLGIKVLRGAVYLHTV